MKPPEVIWLRPRGISPGGFIHLFCNIFSPFFCQASRCMWSINSRFFCTKIPPKPGCQTRSNTAPFRPKMRKPGWLTQDMEGSRQFNYSLVTKVKGNYGKSCTGFNDCWSRKSVCSFSIVTVPISIFGWILFCNIGRDLQHWKYICSCMNSADAAQPTGI